MNSCSEPFKSLHRRVRKLEDKEAERVRREIEVRKLLDSLVNKDKE